MCRQSINIGEEQNRKEASGMTGTLHHPDLVGYAGLEAKIQQLSYLSYPMSQASPEIVKSIKNLFVAVLSYYSKNCTLTFSSQRLLSPRTALQKKMKKIKTKSIFAQSMLFNSRIFINVTLITIAYILLPALHFQIRKYLSP